MNSVQQYQPEAAGPTLQPLQQLQQQLAPGALMQVSLFFLIYVYNCSLCVAIGTADSSPASAMGTAR